MRRIVNGVIEEISAEEQAEIEAEQKRDKEEEDLKEKRYRYRADRSGAYVKSLMEGDSAQSELEVKIETIADVLDAVIKHIYGDSTELDEISAKIKRIKSQFPKPA